MIRIQEHICPSIVQSEAKLNEIAQAHWKFLNPTSVNNAHAYLKVSLRRKCEDLFAGILSEEFKEKYNITTAAAERVKNLFGEFIKDDFAFLRTVVTGRPDELDCAKETIYNFCKESDLYLLDGDTIKQSELGKFLSTKIFNYIGYRGDNKCMKAYRESLKVVSITCPYCNDDRIQIVNLDMLTGEQRAKAYLDLDHFFCKARYPFFAVSFFNLIPTCHNCNSHDKGSKDFSVKTHINPFLESFDEIYKFKLITSKGKFDILIEKTGVKSQDKTAEDLNLLVKYRNNLADLISMLRYYDDHRHLVGTFAEKAFLSYFYDRFPLTKDRILNYTRAKLYRDILKDVDKNNKHISFD